MEASTAVFYLVRLNPPRSAIERFALYEPTGDKLRVVWPDIDKRKLWPFQTHSKRATLPAYHFAVPNHGYEGRIALASALARYLRAPVELRELHGEAPSITVGTPKDAT